MARRGVQKPAAASRGTHAARSYAHEVLKESATILVKTGHSPRELGRMFRDICRTLGEPSRPFDPRVVPYVTGLSHIVAHWYSDPAYRDRDGYPLRIPLKGRRPSLAHLSQRVFPRQDVAVVARSLIRANAIRRRGRLYAPTDRYVDLTQDLATVHVHGLTSLAGMLRTVQYNISRGDGDSTLLERAAVNPAIPVRALPEIHLRIKREATALLWKLDGYLRSWEVEPGTEPTTRIGVGAYAYEDPIVTGVKGRKSRRAAYRSRSLRRKGAPRHA